MNIVGEKQRNFIFFLNQNRGQNLFVLHSQCINYTVTIQKEDIDTEECNYFEYCFRQIVQCIHEIIPNKAAYN